MYRSPLETYHQKLADGQLTPDAAQEALMQHLQALYQALLAAQEATQKRFCWLPGRGRPTPPQNLYICGDVGRGKSMAMDLLVACMPPDFPLRRVHFHAFMAEIHHRLHALRQAPEPPEDPLSLIAQDINQSLTLLCLDELQVHDVADAMILSRLFTLLLEGGLCIIVTSNRPPEDLYLNGLQRESFLKCIDLIRARFRVWSLDSPQDYRLQKLHGHPSYFTPATNIAELQEIFDSLCTLPPAEHLLWVNDRRLKLPIASSGMAWCHFDDLCRQPLGAEDYAAIATEFHTVFLVGIPKMTREDRNEAKRFVTLIDTLYEHKTRLLCSADALPDALYPAGDGSFEFHRTASRLHEMQAADYPRTSSISGSPR